MGAAATLERRFTTELRSTGRSLTGYAATFGTMANIGSFQERVAPGAFRAAIGGDVLALLDHDAGKVLGRTRSGTLQLAEDAKGLAFTLTLPDTQAGRDVQALAERGDLGGMSFGFTVPDGGEEWEGSVRILRSIDLKEISVVSAWPAYAGTEVALRAMQRLDGAQRRARALRLAEARQWQ